MKRKKWQAFKTLDNGLLIILPVQQRYTPDEVWMNKNAIIVQGVVDIVPDCLNRKSKGKWITAYIELSEGFNVEDIDVSTVSVSQINGVYLSEGRHSIIPTIHPLITNDRSPTLYQ